MGDQMLTLILYMLFSTVLFALMFRFWKYKGRDGEGPVVLTVCQVVLALAWPISAPCLGCYVLLNKVLDKITKV